MPEPTHYTLTLETTAYTAGQLPRLEEPQIALAGRSNVGKSSLINCMAGRKSLAKISSKPGKTRSVNFYRVDPGGFYLVDLPGYGYAKASKTDRKAWSQLIEAYLTKATNLKTVVVLLDSRLPPQEIDLNLMGYVQSLNIPLTAVLTKIDKCKQKEQAAALKHWSPILGKTNPPLPFSAVTGRGRDKLWARFNEAAGVHSQPDDSQAVE